MEPREEVLNIMANYQLLLMADLRQSYELADNALEALRNSNAAYSAHAISIGNHEQDSAKLWDFVLTVFIDNKGYKRIKVKYILSDYNKHKSHTKTLRRGACFDDIKKYVSTMAASRCVDHIEHYPIEELREMFPPV